MNAPDFAPGTRSDAARLHIADATLARWVHHGDLNRLRRGYYEPPLPGDTVEARHRRLIDAAVSSATVDVVISHTSAAVMYGLPIWNLSLDRVHLTRPGCGGLANSAQVRYHRAAADPDEITMLNGIPITTVSRTIIDMARSVPFEQAVIAADAALHRRLTTPDDLRAALDRVIARHSAGRAPSVIAFADGRAESPGESRSRVMFARAHLPQPDLQRRIVGASGATVGIVDFYFEEFNTVGEFDGMAKYSRYLRPGETAGQAVVREKVREDAIRDTGPQFVRWIWQEIGPKGPVIDRFDRAFSRAGFPHWRTRARVR